MNNEQKESLQALQDIKSIMDRSSRFVSLSGLSGIAAGFAALVGAYFAGKIIFKNSTPSLRNYQFQSTNAEVVSIKSFMGSSLLHIAIVTLIVALGAALVFTYLRSKKHQIPMWGSTSKRLLINLGIPLLAGGTYLLHLIKVGVFGLIAPGCLLFYGLALVNASKYTLVELRYLGYCQIVLGLINCFFVGYGLYFWAFGFGILHIGYGLYMWNKYERA
jgi:hypothetical protein